MAQYYGAASSPTTAFFSRVTRLLDAEGTLVVEYQVSNIGTHPGQVLEDCEALFGP